MINGRGTESASREEETRYCRWYQGAYYCLGWGVGIAYPKKLKAQPLRQVCGRRTRSDGGEIVQVAVVFWNLTRQV